MGCPSEVVRGDSLIFSVCTHDPETYGELTDADDLPIYYIYEDETGTAVLSGSMSKLDDSNTIGFYSESISGVSTLTFINGKTYTIYIEAIVNTHKGAISYGFKAVDIDIYHADIFYQKDGTNIRDEYTLNWFKNGVVVSVTDPTIQVIKRADGTNLVSEIAMTQIGSTNYYSYNELTNRQTAGESYIIVAKATIDSAVRTFTSIQGRDAA